MSNSIANRVAIFFSIQLLIDKLEKHLLFALKSDEHNFTCLWFLLLSETVCANEQLNIEVNLYPKILQNF